MREAVWIVNPLDETMTVLVLAEDHYAEHGGVFPQGPAGPLRVHSRLLTRRDERLRSTLTFPGLDTEPPADRRPYGAGVVRGTPPCIFTAARGRLLSVLE